LCEKERIKKAGSKELIDTIDYFNISKEKLIEIENKKIIFCIDVSCL